MTRLLFDTNIVIWYFGERNKLSAAIYREIEEAESIYVSVASVWEFAIKRGVGKLKTPDNLLEMLKSQGFRELLPTFTHAMRVETLPLIHKDPFDRMLVAQAIIENLTIVTADAHIPLYDVKTIRV